MNISSSLPNNDLLMKRIFFLIRGRLFFLLALLLCSFFSYAQTVANGKVTDSSGAPLENVSIKVKGTRTGTATGANGSFSISVTTANPVLVFSRVGYTPQEIAAAGRTSLTISLSATHE